MYRDHPRACGAHRCSPRSIKLALGSSPRMRGSLIVVPSMKLDGGIIPAHAGLTDTASLPRSSARGSSPRMRGSQTGCRAVEGRHGIIPAHAGLTRWWMDSSASRRDHPRACGAHKHYTGETAFDSGSSPRMRGSHIQQFVLVPSIGIIPAHAGLTRRDGRHRRACRDHPRACGAHLSDGLSYQLSEGSSPRMRGSRQCGRHGKTHRGIIPAHAGLT